MCLTGNKVMLSLLCYKLFPEAKLISLALSSLEIKNLKNYLDAYGGAGPNENSIYSFNEETFPGGGLFLLKYFS